MWFELLIWPLLALVFLSSATAPLGCFMVWRNMAFIGETLAHSALLGVSLALIFDTSLWGWVMLVCILVGFVINHYQKLRWLGHDTILGVFAHGSLSLGLIVLSLAPRSQDPASYLFGDVLSVTQGDCVAMALVSLLSCVLIALFWKPLLLITIDEDLARSQQINVYRLRLLLMLLIALVIAVGMKLVGLLLLTSLMIIPAAAARLVSKTPLQMVLSSALFASLASLLGFYASYLFDIPTSATIVVSAMLLFIVIFAITHAKQPQ